VADVAAFAHAYISPGVRNVRLDITEMHLYMKPYYHDHVVLVIQGVDDIDSSLWTTGVPFSINYGRKPSQVGTFYGYVTSVSRNWSQIQRVPIAQRSMVVEGLGASYVMKEDLATVYTGMTTAQIATSLARSRLFDTDIPPTEYVWAMKAASGTTEWSFLVNLARASGLTMYCRGTQLRMYPPLTVLTRNATVIPTFYSEDASLTASILSFESHVTELSASEGRRKRTRIVRGINPQTLQPIYAVDSGNSAGAQLGLIAPPPAFSESVIDLVVYDQASADALLPPLGIENQFYIRADAEVAGTASITQSSPVIMEGLGVRDSGLWQALEVTQVYKKHWFSTKLLLGRDSDYDNGKRPGLAANVARPRMDPNATLTLNSPPTALVNGEWRAAWAPPIYGGSGA